MIFLSLVFCCGGVPMIVKVVAGSLACLFFKISSFDFFPSLFLVCFLCFVLVLSSNAEPPERCTRSTWECGFLKWLSFPMFVVFRADGWAEIRLMFFKRFLNNFPPQSLFVVYISTWQC